MENKGLLILGQNFDVPTIVERLNEDIIFNP
jgi:hypothetical protein